LFANSCGSWAGGGTKDDEGLGNGDGGWGASKSEVELTPAYSDFLRGALSSFSAAMPLVVVVGWGHRVYAAQGGK